MSNSKLVNKTILTPRNYDKGRGGYKLKKITIHHAAGVVSIENLGSMFKQGARQVSSHYGIGNDGRIGQYVDEANTAWTDGNWVSNCTSVTIETSNNKTGGQWTVGDKALNSLIKLVADIAKRNGFGTLVKGKNVTWHRMYASTTCPGDYLLSKMDYIVQQANKINNTTPKPSTKKKYSGTFPTLPTRGYFQSGDSSAQVKNLQKFLNWANGDKLTVDGIIGAKTIASVKKFQKAVKITQDGLFGKTSLSKAKAFTK